jgi:hypothetical protein
MLTTCFSSEFHPISYSTFSLDFRIHRILHQEHFSNSYCLNLSLLFRSLDFFSVALFHSPDRPLSCPVASVDLFQQRASFQALLFSSAASSRQYLEWSGLLSLDLEVFLIFQLHPYESSTSNLCQHSYHRAVYYRISNLHFLSSRGQNDAQVTSIALRRC